VRAGTRFSVDELGIGGDERGEIAREVVGSNADVVQPLAVPRQDASGVARFLAGHGEGLHHVCLRSDDLPRDLAALAAAEAELIDAEPRAGAHGSVAFIHPRTLNGVLWELVESQEAGGQT